jgi:hypothetical protein
VETIHVIEKKGKKEEQGRREGGGRSSNLVQPVWIISGLKPRWGY